MAEVAAVRFDGLSTSSMAVAAEAEEAAAASFSLRMAASLATAAALAASEAAAAADFLDDATDADAPAVDDDDLPPVIFRPRASILDLRPAIIAGSVPIDSIQVRASSICMLKVEEGYVLVFLVSNSTRAVFSGHKSQVRCKTKMRYPLRWPS